MRAVWLERSVPRILGTKALAKLWKGAVFGASSPLVFGEVAEPALPGPRWIRVSNRLCGVCASDLQLVYLDVDPRVHPAAVPGPDRVYLGHETVGEVVEVGDGVTRVSVGDRVVMSTRFLGPTCASQEIAPPCRACARGDMALCANTALGRGPLGVGGGWADGYTCHETEVWPVPDALTDEQASLSEPLGCSLRSVLRRPPRAGERVLVLGCGTIGLGCIQAARAAEPGCEVWAVARYPQQRVLAERFGARLLEGDLMNATADVTGARVYAGDLGARTLLGGWDVIYDCVGNAGTLEASLRCVRAGGTVVLVGVHLHRMKVDLTPVWHQEVTVLGAIGHGRERWRGRDVDTFDLTGDLLASGALTIDGMLTHRFPLDRWREAVETSADKRTGAVKVVIEVG
jgi:threonine dehydrogenase-like Zn-dependent dehydrogenase